jgi:hypothetical protein
VARSARVRVVAPTVVTALVGSAVAVVVNLATEWKTNWWAWLAVGALTVVSGGVSLWLHRRQADTDSSPGAGGLSVSGKIDIHAEQGSAAAWRMRDISLGGPPLNPHPLDPPSPGGG